MIKAAAPSRSLAATFFLLIPPLASPFSTLHSRVLMRLKICSSSPNRSSPAAIVANERHHPRFLESSLHSDYNAVNNEIRRAKEPKISLNLRKKSFSLQ
mgnify:CR=1 FL=1